MPVWLVVLVPVVLEPVVCLRFVRLTVDVAVIAGFDDGGFDNSRALPCDCFRGNIGAGA